MLRSALNQAIKWRILSHNPADAVDLPKQQRREMKTLSREQAGKFLKAASSDRWGALWTLLLGSGLRLGEALVLTWDDVDIEDGVVRARLVAHVEGREQGYALDLAGAEDKAIEAVHRRAGVRGGVAAGPPGAAGERPPPVRGGVHRPRVRLRHVRGESAATVEPVAPALPPAPRSRRATED